MDDSHEAFNKGALKSRIAQKKMRFFPIILICFDGWFNNGIWNHEHNLRP